MSKKALTIANALSAMTRQKPANDSPTIDPKKAAEFEKGFNEPVKERLSRQWGNLKKAFK